MVGSVKIHAQNPASNMEETNSKAKLIHQLAGVFDIRHMQHFISTVNCYWHKNVEL